MTTVNVLEISIGVAACLIVLWIALSTLRHRNLRNSGYGVAALSAIDFGQRKVDAKVVRVPDVSRSWASTHVAETAYTVDVVEYRGGAAEAIDA
jgi:hypothetical protein